MANKDDDVTRRRDEEKRRQQDERAQLKILPLVADLVVVDDNGEPHVAPPDRSIFDTWPVDKDLAVERPKRSESD